MQERVRFSELGADLHRSVKRFFCGIGSEECVFLWWIDLCDMGAFSKSIFAHIYIEFNISDPQAK